MPREIKFRFWDLDSKKMLSPNLPEHMHIASYNGLGLIDDSDEDEDGYSLEMDTVFLQYTGIKDSAGNEIYEGDIVQKAGNRYLIKWCDKTARYVVEVLKAYVLLVRGVEFPLWQYVEENGQVNLEVIGNIYEHPELLES